MICINQYVSDTQKENGHSEVPMADIDLKISSRYSVHYQPALSSASMILIYLISCRIMGIPLKSNRLSYIIYFPYN